MSKSSGDLNNYKVTEQNSELLRAVLRLQAGLVVHYSVTDNLLPAVGVARSTSVKWQAQVLKGKVGRYFEVPMASEKKPADVLAAQFTDGELADCLNQALLSLNQKAEGAVASYTLHLKNQPGAFWRMKCVLSNVLESQSLLCVMRPKLKRQSSVQTIDQIPNHALIAYNLQVREEERKSIARDIHDEIAQLITVAKMDLRMLEKSMPELSVQASEYMREVHEQLKDAVTVSRDIIARLRPPAVDLGLVASIEWLVSEFAKRHGTSIKFSCICDDVILCQEYCVHVFRIVQESLNNISKYANATEVSITLSETDVSYGLTISDNGKGFDQMGKPLGYGLQGMRERMLLVGGQFNIQSEPGAGVLIALKLPKGKAI